jgi:flagellar basal-body rod modification protein FlgD
LGTVEDRLSPFDETKNHESETMTISGVTNTNSYNAAGAATAPDELGRNDFLNLLVAQLQYQDPLNPMDSTDFTAQLAQFSSLEQLTNMSTQLEELTAAQTSVTNAQAVAYIGRTVLSNGNATHITDGTADPLQLVLDAAAEDVFVSIYDDTGALRSTFNTDRMTAGRGSVEWDGIDMNGNALPDGNYWFEVSAVDTAGEDVGVYPLSSGVVSGVGFEDGEARLVVNGLLMSIDSVIEVSQRETTE